MFSHAKRSDKNALSLWPVFLFTFLFLLLLSGCGKNQEEESKDADAHRPPREWTIDSAISSLRGVDLAGLSDEERNRLSERLNDAWSFLIESGKDAEEAVSEAVREEQEKESIDSFFLLGASRLLANMMDDEEEADDVARNAIRLADLSKSSADAFYLTHQIAKKRDQEDRPLLRKFLSIDENARAFLYMHSLILDWKLQLVFTFGVYGTDSLPIVREGLSSSDPNVRRNAAFLVGVFFDEESASDLRRLTKDSDPAVRAEAVQALGYVGVPEDVDLLSPLLIKDQEWKVRQFAAFSLFELSSAEAVAHLIQGLKDDQKEVRSECIAGLLYYHDKNALSALVRHLSAEQDQELRALIINGLAQVGTLSQIEPLEALCNEEIIPCDDSFQKAIQAIREMDRQESFPFPWPALPESGPQKADLVKLEGKRATVLESLSDEALYEWRRITQQIQIAHFKERLADNK